jgi:cytochrome c2
VIGHRPRLPICFRTHGSRSLLADPKELVPGNKMFFPPLKKPEDRTNAIAYFIQQQEAD